MPKILLYPHNVQIPTGNDIALFRNKRDGLHYYKKANNSIIKLERADDVYYIREEFISKIHNHTGENFDLFSTDEGIAITFFNSQTIAVAGGGGGGRGISGYSGASGGGGGGETLAQTLVLGNTTGGTNMILSDGDTIEAPDGRTETRFNYLGAGTFGYRTLYEDGIDKDANFFIAHNVGLGLFAIGLNYTNGLQSGNITVNAGQFGISHTANIQFDAPNYNYQNLVAYADDASAGVGGLVTGDIYQTTGAGGAPLNVAGIIMIKQ